MSSRPRFASLWSNHPAVQGDTNPCRSAAGEPYFENQCAIRMAVALERCGVSLASFRGARCWHRHVPATRHVLRAQELADWLRGQRTLFGVPEIRSHREAVAPADPAPPADPLAAEAVPAPYRGRSGILFLRNFWGTGNQGDHIDVWDGALMGHGSPGYFARAEQVWFWPLL